MTKLIFPLKKKALLSVSYSIIQIFCVITLLATRMFKVSNYYTWLVHLELASAPGPLPPEWEHMSVFPKQRLGWQCQAFNPNSEIELWHNDTKHAFREWLVLDDSARHIWSRNLNRLRIILFEPCTFHYVGIPAATTAPKIFSSQDYEYGECG